MLIYTVNNITYYVCVCGERRKECRYIACARGRRKKKKTEIIYKYPVARKPGDTTGRARRQTMCTMAAGHCPPAAHATLYYYHHRRLRYYYFCVYDCQLLVWSNVDIRAFRRVQIIIQHDCIYTLCRRLWWFFGIGRRRRVGPEKGMMRVIYTHKRTL